MYSPHAVLFTHAKCPWTYYYLVSTIQTTAWTKYLGSHWLYGLIPPHILTYIPNTISFGDIISLRLWAWFFLRNCLASLKSGTNSVPKTWGIIFPYIWWRKFINSLSWNVITILRIPLKSITNGLCLLPYLFSQYDRHCVCTGTTAQLNGQNQC